MYDYVSDILKFRQVPMVDFSFNGVVVCGPKFQKVIQALADGKITVEADPSIKAGHAGYDTQNDRFVFPNEDIPRMLLPQALVVHEAVHAACDIDGTPIQTLLSETVAYLAQGLFVYYFLKPQFDADSSYWPFGEGLLKIAFEASKPARNMCGVALSAYTVQPLMDAIIAHDKYKDKIGTNVPYNGI